MSAFDAAARLHTALKRLAKQEAGVLANVRARYENRRTELLADVPEHVLTLLRAATIAEAEAAKLVAAREAGDTRPAESILDEQLPPIGGLEVDRASGKSRRV